MKLKYALFAVLALMTAPKGFSMLNEKDHLGDAMVQVFAERLANPDRLRKFGTESLEDEAMRRLAEQAQAGRQDIKESKDDNAAKQDEKKKKKQNKKARQKQKNDQKDADLDDFLSQRADTAKKEKAEMLNELEAVMQKEVADRVSKIFNPASTAFNKTHEEINSMLENKEIVLFTPEKISQKKSEYEEHLEKKLDAAIDIKKFIEKAVNSIKELEGDTTIGNDTLSYFTSMIDRCRYELAIADQAVKNRIKAATEKFTNDNLPISLLSPNYNSLLSPNYN
jgi:hypothetical protein